MARVYGALGVVESTSSSGHAFERFSLLTPASDILRSAMLPFLYVVFIGLPLCLFCVGFGLFLCFTIIGLPLGITLIYAGLRSLTLQPRPQVHVYYIERR